MTKLSPAAQEVMDAVHGVIPHTTIADSLAIAAALRAVADQVVPEQLPKFDFYCGYTLYRTTDTIRHQLLAIATELENHV